MKLKRFFSGALVRVRVDKHIYSLHEYHIVCDLVVRKLFPCHLSFSETNSYICLKSSHKVTSDKNHQEGGTGETRKKPPRDRATSRDLFSLEAREAHYPGRVRLHLGLSFIRICVSD